METILVIEDEKDLADLVAFHLEKEGYRAVKALDGVAELEAARESSPDLILLDLMLPGMSGSDVCRTLKNSPKTAAIPIILLTAKGEEIDRVVGFEIGADDYVVKPFSVRELVLRIRAVLRRRELPVADGPSIEFGNLRLDRAAHRVWVETEEVELTA